MEKALDGFPSLADKIRRAFAGRGLSAFGGLLAEEVTWGDVDNPRGCRNRSDVLSVFALLLDKGVVANICELETGTAGILCELTVEWPEGDPRGIEPSLLHVYMVKDDRIYQIRRYDDRESAKQAAGINKER